ncbi:sodium-dependent transporter [Methanobrevibacter sp.]|uniref:sodium-dependent transporter n=1 Tax=Methanobrevibacter sp. TaxID=66852 RepID=UPI003890D2E4
MNKSSQWNSVVTFVVAMVGLTIGIGNIWRFSYVLYNNGGGSFFIPYFMAIAVMGVPFLILEYGLGFSLKKSFSKLMHDIRPEFEIFAWMIVLLVFIVVIYYMVILSWDLVYLFNSFNFGWGADTASFFTNNVGGNSDLSSPIGIVVPTFIGIIVLWVIFWFISNHDVNDGIGMVSRVLMPMLFIIMLFIFLYSFTLPGSKVGLYALLNPNWNALLDIRVWLAAFAQIIFTLSIGQAMVYTYATYLNEDARLIDDVVMVVTANSLYEIFIAVGVFSILGYMSVSSSIPIDLLVTDGSGLIFVVFPQIFNSMGFIGHILGPLLFLSILFAGITSSFALFEPLLSSILDKFGWSRKKGVTILSIIACICSLIFATSIGSHLLELVDSFVNEFAILILIAIQSVIFSWYYGVEKVMPALNKLSKFKVGKKWKFTLKYILPIIIIVIWVYGVVGLFSEADLLEIIVDLVITFGVLGLSIFFTKFNSTNS